jgi:site-specific DNA-cytosine methylase
LNVLSLFDGISIGQLALKKAGIQVDNYYASEIKPIAIQVTQFNFPNTVQLGDVTKLDTDKLHNIDMLIGGSPCQDLSIAMKDRKGLKGEKSKLFWEYVKILKKVKPRYFFLENVARMSQEDKEIINNVLGVEPIRINSSLVSAQLRDRYYWTNIPNVTQPEDRGILLKDILESGYTDRDKARALLVSDSRPLRDKKKNVSQIQKHRLYNNCF